MVGIQTVESDVESLRSRLRSRTTRDSSDLARPRTLQVVRSVQILDLIGHRRRLQLTCNDLATDC